MQKINFKIIVHLLGVLLLFNGGLMLTAVLVSILTKDGATYPLALSAFSILGVGGLTMLATRTEQLQIFRREGYLIVSLGWIVMALTGMLPYLLTGSLESFSAAFFETLSGYTTTGASVITDVEVLPKGLLFWRSMTHWIGGMGIIVLALAILPLLGIGGMQLFTAEAPGPSGDKLHPRITDTAKRLWLIYLGYTLAETILLYVAGMSFFDAINHAMSTLSTGGFSTKNSSVAFWNDTPIIQYIIILFMLIAGSNFVLSYFAFTGKIKRIFQDDEWKTYLGFVFGFTFLATAILYFYQAPLGNGFEYAQPLGTNENYFRHSLFQVTALITTTGFVSADLVTVLPFLTVLLFGLMFLGGSAGSTSGGIKIVRHLLMIRSGFLEFKRALHPNAIIQTRYNDKIVSEKIVYNVLGFFILYMLSFIIGTIGFSLMGLDFTSALGIAAATLGNVGPALGDFGPDSTYAALPAIGQLWAAFLMLIGRLELFTVLILFTPFFWGKR
jgi:trk system potassium uptake protein TrkH